MPEKGSNNIKRWAVLSAIGIEMGIIIYVFVKLGAWLDASYNSGNNGYIIATTFIGIAISLFLVVKQTNKLNS